MDVLLTLGGMRAPIDEVRYMANESSGRLGLEILKNLVFEEAEVTVLVGTVDDDVAREIQKFGGQVKVIQTPTFLEMKKAMLETPANVALFAAAVLDFIPDPFVGKLSSSEPTVNLTLRRTPKLIDLYKKAFPKTRIVAFKLESQVSEEELISKAFEVNQARKPFAVVANLREKVAGKNYEGFILNPSTRGHKKHSSRKDLAIELVRNVVLKN